MKKNYIIPASQISYGDVEQMIASSITNIGGESNLPFGSDDTPDNADVKELGDNFWYED